MQNKRAPEMQRIIAAAFPYSWEKRTVVDLGCGYGDMSKFALDRGVEFVHAVDKDPKVLRMAGEKCKDARFFPICEDIEGFLQKRPLIYDVAFFFSVMPYLRDPVGMLKRILMHSFFMFCEVQYTGDGPGMIDNENVMEWLLKDVGWGNVKNVGHTIVDERNARRDIWFCRR